MIKLPWLVSVLLKERFLISLCHEQKMQGYPSVETDVKGVNIYYRECSGTGNGEEAVTHLSVLFSQHRNCPGEERLIRLLCLSFFNSIGGLILDKTVTDPNFEGMAVFTPVINGRLDKQS